MISRSLTLFILAYQNELFQCAPTNETTKDHRPYHLYSKGAESFVITNYTHKLEIRHHRHTRRWSTDHRCIFKTLLSLVEDQVELANNEITLLWVGMKKMNLSSTCRWRRWILITWFIITGASSSSSSSTLRSPTLLTCMAADELLNNHPPAALIATSQTPKSEISALRTIFLMKVIWGGHNSFNAL